MLLQSTTNTVQDSIRQACDRILSCFRNWKRRREKDDRPVQIKRNLLLLLNLSAHPVLEQYRTSVQVPHHVCVCVCNNTRYRLCHLPTLRIHLHRQATHTHTVVSRCFVSTRKHLTDPHESLPVVLVVFRRRQDSRMFSNQTHLISESVRRWSIPYRHLSLKTSSPCPTSKQSLVTEAIHSNVTRCID